MRPVRIELEGFSAYRSRVEVDLSAVAGSDVALFSLSGATGAGKSSLIDAIIFALYGRIPRLDGRAVAPVISAGTDRARVRVDFEVDGVMHTAVRLAQRTPSGGATIKEARLQRGDDVLASGADNVTSAVEDLLSLSFEDFTRTVVLPQGKFSRFLEAAPRERQDLLRDLLGLEVYGRVRELATRRKAVADDRASSARSRLEMLEVPHDEALAAATARLETLEELAPSVGAGEKKLFEYAGAVEAADKDVSRLEMVAERLVELEPPDGLEELGELVSRARHADADAREALEMAMSGLRAVEAERDDGPDGEQLALAGKAHADLDDVVDALSDHEIDPAKSAVGDAEAALVMASANVDDLRGRLGDLHITHAAHAIGSALVIGEPCPVCRHPVDDLPNLKKPKELNEVEADLAAAVAAASARQKDVDGARAALVEKQTRHTQLESRHLELAAVVGAGPNREELTHLLALVDELKGRHALARKTAGDAEASAKETGKALEDLASRESAIGRLLQTSLLAVASVGLAPPVSESDDAVVQWKDLLAWRDDARESVTVELQAAAETAAKARSHHEEARQGLLSLLVAAGLTSAEPYAATLAAETERARQLLAAQQKAVTEGAILRKELESESAAAAVAGALATHLKVDGFERWMMAGALHNLVVGANGLLAQLSDGGYSLDPGDGTFAVIDHRNADERRSVATLSGGETFLVSLALALSLAETLAGSGGASLDAIILDEGFGTLDDESLDTVAAVLEGLAGQGLMVGVITHVKELAARATVRYEVTRSAKGSTVKELA